MDNVKFQFIGWCNETDPDGTKHDKVWVAFSVNGRLYSGWGKRGKTIKLKDFGTGLKATSEHHKTIKQKRKTYDQIDLARLITIFPEFDSNLESSLIFKILSSGA